MSRLLLPLLLLLLPALSRAQHFDLDRLARVDRFLQGLVDDGVVPNAQTYVAHRGKVIHRKSFGFSDLEARTPARPDDIYRIASQTKALVSVGLMLLFEEGAFQLEDPVSRYLPAFAEMRVLDDYTAGEADYTTVPAATDITIRHLLSHTAGISDNLPVPVGPEARVPYLVTLEPETLAGVVDRIAKRPLAHQPGAAFTYGLSTEVVGRLIEVLAGQPLDEFLRERLFTPLGMTDTHFYLPEGKHDRLVTLYSKPEREAGLVVHASEVHRFFPLRGAKTHLSAAGGLVGTIDDYGRFCQMLVNGGELDGRRYLNPRTIALMTKNQTGEHRVWTRNDPFGLGFQLISEHSRYGDLAPVGAYTWGGLYCTEYTIDPVNDLVLLVYTNVQPIPQYGEVVRKFRTLVYQALVE